MEGKKLLKGLIHIYTGDGKGKTTAAIGLGVRAAGHGLKVYMIQFMKGRVNYGELETIKSIPDFTIIQFGRPEFVNKANPEKIDIDGAADALQHARQIISSGKYDVVILDEVNVAVDFGLIAAEDVLEIMRKKPAQVEMIMTGRNAKQEFIEAADLVTEMREIKHYYSSGIEARLGIEF
ncbi:MAG: cob(I)yrinic acid a,c-diamide adenosyltransferase [Firmicutes bacterium]|nr:cob(I)yrinic acid a,c-diamide adenosyltransferase [Bacillota bacterium]